jgi:hypothetical protein
VRRAARAMTGILYVNWRPKSLEGDDVAVNVSGNKRRKMSPKGIKGEAKDQSAEEETVELEEFEMEHRSL